MPRYLPIVAALAVTSCTTMLDYRVGGTGDQRSSPWLDCGIAQERCDAALALVATPGVTFPEVLAELEKAANDPEVKASQSASAAVHWNTALVLMASGDLDAARALLDLVVTIAPPGSRDRARAEEERAHIDRVAASTAPGREPVEPAVPVPPRAPEVCARPASPSSPQAIFFKRKTAAGTTSGYRCEEGESILLSNVTIELEQGESISASEGCCLHLDDVIVEGGQGVVFYAGSSGRVDRTTIRGTEGADVLLVRGEVAVDGSDFTGGSVTIFEAGVAELRNVTVHEGLIESRGDLVLDGAVLSSTVRSRFVRSVALRGRASLRNVRVKSAQAGVVIEGDGIIEGGSFQSDTGPAIEVATHEVVVGAGEARARLVGVSSRARDVALVATGGHVTVERGTYTSDEGAAWRLFDASFSARDAEVTGRSGIHVDRSDLILAGGRVEGTGDRRTAFEFPRSSAARIRNAHVAGAVVVKESSSDVLMVGCRIEGSVSPAVRRE